jgi:hypothetical protein
MSAPPANVAHMSEHSVSIEELRKRLGNAILLATTRNCRFVVTRYGVPMGAVVGHKDLQRLKRLDEAEGKVEPGGPPAEQIEKERYDQLVESIFTAVLLGGSFTPRTEEESDIHDQAYRLKFRARFDPEQKQILDELTAALKLRHPEKAAA